MAGDVLFRRSWQVVVNGNAFTEPYSASFHVERDITPSPNKAGITLWNLSPDMRGALAKAKDPEVQISAGYETLNGVLFRGQAREIVHTYDGPDWQTTIECGDSEAALRQAITSHSYAPGTPVAMAIRDLVGDLNIPDTAGALALSDAAFLFKKFQNGTVTEGPAKDELTQILRSHGWEWSVQSGVLQMGPQGSPIAPQAILLTADTGLVAPSPCLTPKGELRAKCFLRPDVVPGALVSIVSRTVTGAFRVEKTKATGETSGATWYTEIEGKPL